MRGRREGDSATRRVCPCFLGETSGLFLLRYSKHCVLRKSGEISFDDSVLKVQALRDQAYSVILMYILLIDWCWNSDLVSMTIIWQG